MPTRSNGGESSPHSVICCPETVIDIPTGFFLDIDRYLQSQGTSDGRLCCRVRRDKSKNLLECFIEEGNVFVLAAVRRGKDWLISEQRNAPKDSQPVAVVSPHKEGNSYTCGRQKAGDELLHLRHIPTQLSDQLPELNTIEVAQSVEQDMPTGVLAQACRVKKGYEPSSGIAILESKLPKWNVRTNTYELAFHGRAKLASARNFQLVLRGGRYDQPVLIYGKLEEDEFALDFAYPLSILQAFAIALTTCDW